MKTAFQPRLKAVLFFFNKTIGKAICLAKTQTMSKAMSWTMSKTMS